MVRQKYSLGPEDALYDGENGKHCLNFPVVQFPVSAVQSLQTEHPNTHTVFTFSVRHVPSDCIYPHSEIHTFEDGQLIPEIKPPSVKLWLRKQLSEISAVAMRPN